MLACIRGPWHGLPMESGGSYRARNGTQSGAYQDIQPTWDSGARGIGRGDLVGVWPGSASPADQDSVNAWVIESDGGILAFRWPTPSRVCAGI